MTAIGRGEGGEEFQPNLSFVFSAVLALARLPEKRRMAEGNWKEDAFRTGKGIVTGPVPRSFMKNKYTKYKKNEHIVTPKCFYNKIICCRLKYFLA